MDKLSRVKSKIESFFIRSTGSRLSSQGHFAWRSLGKDYTTLVINRKILCVQYLSDKHACERNEG